MAEITTGTAVPFALPSTSGHLAVGSSFGEYLGLSVVATGEAATVTLYDCGSEAEFEAFEAEETGTKLPPVLEVVALAAGASASLNYVRPGRRVLKGIWVGYTGKPKGSVFQ